MERLLPLIWTAFGMAFAFAITLPKPGTGGFSAFLAICLLAFACLMEIHAGRR